MNSRTLIVIVGPTAVGKTDLSIDIAKYFNAPIVSSDSRQIFKQMNIGTAAPSAQQLAEVEHHFIQTLDIDQPYTAGQYEKDALATINMLFETNEYVLLTGGSGLYIDALCDGIDAIPATDGNVREELKQLLSTDGIGSLLERLKILDEEFYNQVDKNNPNRVIRALEVCMTTGQPYSKLRVGAKKKRDFKIVKVGLNIDRDVLYARINQRVDLMVEQGLVEEARVLHPFKHYNSLQTVGYKEFFDYFEDITTLEQAIELLKRNTRRYAKRQLTWFRKYDDMEWFSPVKFDSIVKYITNK